MKPKFDCLYFLDNTTVFIIEIKRTDLAEGADISAVYNWMKIDKATLEVTSLSFRSMDSSAQVEERFFEEGYLKFNEDEGTFIEKFNSGQHQLTNRKNVVLSEAIKSSIENYLLVKHLVH
ncbi:hypothetical protein [Pedobacter sp. Hv1]|uniref:hypothetical protein n=1 Tax=Pedobacter sp. Hv1 TaxID=1740090 RepID=UPI0006D8CA76|nr:hypothetical protein [Pedobacter sp. Hv1]KQC00748.1 hypothetical protein AQF98_08700 [Pedobacter sp. Hv1]